MVKVVLIKMSTRCIEGKHEKHRGQALEASKVSTRSIPVDAALPLEFVPQQAVRAIFGWAVGLGLDIAAKEWDCFVVGGGCLHFWGVHGNHAICEADFGAHASLGSST